jgi:hypothetical protein
MDNVGTVNYPEGNTMSLDLKDLRAANKARLPQFKNKHGQLAHSKPDGSDWSPAQWFQALVGEVGEYAEQRLFFEDGLITLEEFTESGAKELADVQCYLDLNAQRALDTTSAVAVCDPAQQLLVVMSHLGNYANARKKLDRGDLSQAEFAAVATTLLNSAVASIQLLQRASFLYGGKAAVIATHPSGIDLGQATRDKFNEVSLRVGCEVTL